MSMKLLIGYTTKDYYRRKITLRSSLDTLIIQKPVLSENFVNIKAVELAFDDECIAGLMGRAKQCSCITAMETVTGSQCIVDMMKMNIPHW